MRDDKLYGDEVELALASALIRLPNFFPSLRSFFFFFVCSSCFSFICGKGCDIFGFGFCLYRLDERCNLYMDFEFSLSQNIFLFFLFGGIYHLEHSIYGKNNC